MRAAAESTACPGCVCCDRLRARVSELERYTEQLKARAAWMQQQRDQHREAAGRLAASVRAPVVLRRRGA